MSPPMIRFLLIPVLGDTQEMTCEKPFPKVKAAILPLLDDTGLEHVAVLYEGKRRDMFVGENSSINGRHIRNTRGTAIYRNNTLTRSPGTDPESLPAISGPVILFPDEIVWL